MLERKDLIELSPSEYERYLEKYNGEYLLMIGTMDEERIDKTEKKGLFVKIKNIEDFENITIKHVITNAKDIYKRYP